MKSRPQNDRAICGLFFALILHHCLSFRTGIFACAQYIERSLLFESTEYGFCSEGEMHVKGEELSAGCHVGRLTIIEEAPRVNGRRCWRCRCDCGAECVVWQHHIKSGHTKSCGCLRAQIMERNRLPRINIAGKRFGRLVALEPTQRRCKTSVVWKCQCDCGRIAYCDTDSLNGGNTRSCGCLLEEQRRKNMKKAIHFVDGTCIEKVACQRESAANTSGHRGVWQNENQRWRASIQFRGKRYNLGTYGTFEEATEARLKGEEMVREYLEDYYGRQEKNAIRRIGEKNE